MAQESKAYSPAEFLFHSKGLVARYAEDRPPEYTYLDFRNCAENLWFSSYCMAGR